MRSIQDKFDSTHHSNSRDHRIRVLISFINNIIDEIYIFKCMINFFYQNVNIEHLLLSRFFYPPRPFIEFKY